MKNLDAVLVKIKSNPEKYIGEKSIKRLRLFITGYLTSQYNEIGECSKSLVGFEEFVQQKYNIIDAISSYDIILLYSVTDAYAFDEFYKIYDEFLTRENK